MLSLRRSRPSRRRSRCSCWLACSFHVVKTFRVQNSVFGKLRGAQGLAACLSILVSTVLGIRGALSHLRRH
eukprot:7634846-Pyramimonas_sp.AAC.1